MTLIKKRLCTAAAVGLLLTLAACGGGTDRSYNAGGTGGAVGAGDDSFIAQVRALVGLDGDSPDVLPFDSIIATTPENSEPVGI